MKDNRTPGVISASSPNAGALGEHTRRDTHTLRMNGQVEGLTDKEASVDAIPQLLSKSTVCQLLDGVTAKHIENLVRSGRMPEPVYLGRCPRWRRGELLDWIEAGCPTVDGDRFIAWQKDRGAANR